MLVTREILLRPAAGQARLMAQHAGYARWTYNALRQMMLDTPDGELWPNAAALAKRLRRERPEWAKALSQNVFDNARLNFDRAMQRFWECRKGKHKWHAAGSCGIPKPHKRGRGPDRFTASDGHPERNRIRQRHIYLPKIGWVAMRADAPTDQPRQIHIKRKVGNRWFACIVFDNGKELPDAPGGGAVTGVDGGIKTLAYTSDGQEFPNPKPLVKAQRKLRRLDKAISRSVNQHGKAASNRRRVLYAKRAKLHERIANQRRNAHRQTASAIAKSSGTVVVESLKVAGLLKNRRLAKALSDAAISGLLREIKWQCAKRGVKVIEAGRNFPSTQICARCGSRPAARLDLSVRVYRCGKCGWTADRDANAAINLKQLAPAFWESINGRRGGVSHGSWNRAVASEAPTRTGNWQPALIPGAAPAQISTS